MNTYTGKMDIYLLPTTQVAATSELPSSIKPFPDLCGPWPTEEEWQREQKALLKMERVKASDGEVEMWVDGGSSSCTFQVWGFHPNLAKAKPGDALLVEVFPFSADTQKISEHSIVRFA